MKILITGAKGMLGAELVHFLQNKHEIIGMDKKDLDISNESIVNSVLFKIKPNIVINCGAMTDVDLCETEQDRAWRINTWGCRNLALSCQQIGCRLISFSTDYVFNGKKSLPYHEFDTADGGINIYGQTKFGGEQLISQICSDYLIVRVSWLYGHNGKNFVETMLDLASRHPKQINVVNDQIGNPTSTEAVANAVEGLLLRPDYSGIVHVTCEGQATWFDFAKEIFKLKGINQTLMPCTTDALPRPANRPKNSRLEKRILKLLDLPAMPDWRDALQKYLTN